MNNCVYHCRQRLEVERDRIEKLTRGHVVSVRETEQYIEFTVRLKKV